MVVVAQLTAEEIKILRKYEVPYHISRFGSQDNLRTVFVLGKIGNIKELHHKFIEPILVSEYPVNGSILKIKELSDDMDAVVQRILDMSIAFSDNDRFIEIAKKFIYNHEEGKMLLKMLLQSIYDKPQIAINITYMNRCILCTKQTKEDYCDPCTTLLNMLDEDTKKFMMYGNKSMFAMLEKIRNGIEYQKLLTDSSLYNLFEKIEKNDFIKINYYDYPKKAMLTSKGRRALDIFIKATGADFNA